MTPKRKLAAIVFADIAGYTDQASKDEGSALHVRERVERLIKSSTLSHRGRVVKVLGDGAMLEFASAVEAVGCALDIQAQMAHLNEELALPDSVNVRVGVHVGEVVEEGDDLYGNAVNIASRVHNLARPGGICITREVYVQIRPILKLQVDPVDGASSGRLPEPIEVFQIVGEAGDVLAGPTGRGRGKRLLVGLVAGVMLGVVAGAAYLMSDVASPDDAPITGAIGQATHRILLPDWVTPGERFELDAGDQAKRLAVYYGNRKARTEVAGTKLRVWVPDDIPTEKTTISVFEEGQSTPLMTQQTQVIRSQMVAMNDKPQPGPEVDIKTTPTSTPSSTPLDRPTASKERSSPATKDADASEPPAPPEPGSMETRTARGTLVTPETPKVAHIAPVPAPGMKIEGYDKLVMAMDEGDFRKLDRDLEKIPAMSPEYQKAMRAISHAAGGHTDQARKLIVEVKGDLKALSIEDKREIESLLKSAEALVEEPPGTVRVGPDPKWAEAFAYSINNGTNNFAGLALLNRLVREEEWVEARRVYNRLKVQPNLSTVEKRALDKLDMKIKAHGE